MNGDLQKFMQALANCLYETYRNPIPGHARGVTEVQDMYTETFIRGLRPHVVSVFRQPYANTMLDTLQSYVADAGKPERDSS